MLCFMALTYGQYLALEQLLGAQRPLSDAPEHDELLFIVIHQVYELWFKQILHESERLIEACDRGESQQALSTLKRILTVLKTLVAQVDILETMTPMSFNSFRQRLETASGFESVQFRRVEFTFGYKRPSMLQHYPDGSPERLALQQALEARTVWDAFLVYLDHHGFELPSELLHRDVTHPVVASEALQQVLLRAYHGNVLVAQVCERLVDLDEGLQEWRYRHVKMVERTIGTKFGSGGSSGVEYLKSTLFRPLFPDLWAIRVQL
jgi:tryptophan 2,3-dioxygenase